VNPHLPIRDKDKQHRAIILFLPPTFHDSKIRCVKSSSEESVSIRGKIAATIWFDVSRSNCRSFSSSSAAVAAETTPA
jgi:hypothetical protein